jgi:hypothetical protein
MTGSDAHEAVAQAFEAQRERLVAVAYRMLGSRADAEDAVRDGHQPPALLLERAGQGLAGTNTGHHGRLPLSVRVRDMTRTGSER